MTIRTYVPTLIRIPKRSPWVNQFLVIGALLQREVASRFGKYRLGFFWMLFEPVMSVIFIGLILGSIVGAHRPGDSLRVLPAQRLRVAANFSPDR